MTGVQDQRGYHVTYHGLAQGKFDDKYGKPIDGKRTTLETIANYRKYFGSHCNAGNVFRFLERRIPGIRVLRTYQFRKHILGDIIAGVSVGALSIPQGLGYAILASVPPILGLYTCFIPAFIYFFLGTSRHIAMGTMALSSLVVATAVEKGTAEISQLIKEGGQNNETNITALTELLEYQQTSIATSVTFFGGILLLIMSFCQMGFIISYMGDAFVSGYLTGANIRVLTHQVIFCLGLKKHLGVHSGLLNYFYLLYDIFKNVTNINWGSVVVSVITLVIVLSVKYGINERFKSKLKLPVPIELIVIVIGIIVSHFSDLERRFGVRTLKHVPQGMPALTPPSIENLKLFPVESFFSGVISFVFAGMMAKLFSQRHDYELDNNQELFASGVCNAVGGLFSCIGVSVSPPRPFLMEMTGGHTQVTYLINALVILLTLLLLAPFLVSLPVCILACLVVTSCIPLFVHYTASITYWKTNKCDFTIWFFTAVSTLVIDVDIAMILGVGFSFIMVIFQTQSPYSSILAKNTDDGVLLDSKRYTRTNPLPGVRIFKFESPLYFATIDVFKRSLFSNTINISVLKRINLSKISKKESIEGKGPVSMAVRFDPSVEIDDDKVEERNTTLSTPLTERKRLQSNPDRVNNDIHTIIIDCSCVPFADTPGARCLAKVRKDFGEYGVSILVSSCSCKVEGLVKRVPECADLIENGLFPSMYDALYFASTNQH